MVFKDREAVMDWMDANQLGRRNLSPDAFRLLLGRRYNRTKKEHGKRGKEKIAQNEQSFGTAEALGSEYGVSRETVKRAGKFAEEVAKTPELQAAIANRKPVLQVALPQDLKTNLLAPVQRRLQKPPAKSNFLAVKTRLRESEMAAPK
jgi:hypothetical protein